MRITFDRGVNHARICGDTLTSAFSRSLSFRINDDMMIALSTLTLKKIIRKFGTIGLSATISDIMNIKSLRWLIDAKLFPIWDPVDTTHCKKNGRTKGFGVTGNSAFV